MRAEFGADCSNALLNLVVPVGDGWLDQSSVEVTRLVVDDGCNVWLARQNRANARQYDWANVATSALRRLRVDWLNGGFRG